MSDDRPPDLPVIPEDTYTNREEFARGGLGRVLRATDRSMGRVVAIKELLPGTDVEEARFIREALVTGRLEHPSIVPVYEAGRWPSGEPFYTMKLVSGRPLRDIVRETRALDERLALVPKVIAVAEAIGYAHSRRVIHRDIKPSNVIVGQFGETVVIDWGLAKELGAREEATSSGEDRRPQSDELTSYGDVLGTPAYMAPEQAQGDAVDERTDVYALGALLYFVLSGAAPHEATRAARPPDAASADVTGTDFIAVARRPPVPLAERRPDVPRELHTIVAKAMALDPRQRYPTAKEFADDLSAFQTGRLVSAHHYTLWALVRRWVRKNRVPVAVSAAALAVLVAGATVAVTRIIEARDLAVASRAAEEDAREQAERRSDDLILLQAHASLARDPTAALAWLRRYPETAPGWEGARTIVAEALASGIAADVWRVADGAVSQVRLGPDGRTVVAIGGDGVARLFDPARRAWRILDATTVGDTLALSPDGATVAIGDENRNVVLIPVGGGARPRILGAHDDSISALAFSPDGRMVASTSLDRTVRLWPVSGAPPTVLRGHELATVGVAFSPDGARLASGSEDATLRLWDVAAGAPMRVLRADRSVLDVAFAPDGHRVAAATRSGPRVWDLSETSPEGRLLGDRPWGEVYGIAWRGNGTLVTAGVDGLGVWDRSLASARWLAGHDGAVNTIALAADASALVSGGTDGTIRVWPLRPEAGVVLREGNQPAGTGARPRISPDGKLIAAPGQDGTIYLSRGGEVVLLRGHEGPVREIAFSPDGAQLASYGLDRTVRLWDVARGTGRVLAALPGQAFRLRYAPDGRHLGWTQGFEELDLYDLEKGAPGCVFRGHNDSASEFSPDGKWIAYADGYDLRVGDVSGCGSRRILGHRGSIFGVAWSRDGRLVATASGDRAIGVADLEGRTPRIFRAHDKPAYGITFSPDGASLASVGFDGVARISGLDGQPRLILRGHDKPLLYVAFTPDGRLLATAGADDSVRVWDTASGDLVQRETDTGLNGLAISPDGSFLVSAGPRALRRWPIERGAVLPRAPAALHAVIDTATRARIDDAGKLQSR